jgi:divalent metal cation (Fe/Co/Zn/Cd) transporter
VERAQAAALASAGVGLLVLGLKFFAWWITGSLALYSAGDPPGEELEAEHQEADPGTGEGGGLRAFHDDVLINVVAAMTAFVALRVAAQPADQNHPYGHHKAEYLD